MSFYRPVCATVLVLLLAACASFERNPPFTPLGGTIPASEDLSGRLEREWNVRQKVLGTGRPLTAPPNLGIQEGRVFAAVVYAASSVEVDEVNIAYWIEDRDVYYVQLRADETHGGLTNRWFGPYPLAYEAAPEEPENETPARVPAGAYE